VLTTSCLEAGERRRGSRRRGRGRKRRRERETEGLRVKGGTGVEAGD